MIASYIALTKPKIIILLLITAVGGLFLASDGIPGAIVTLSVIIGGSLAAGGANALNHYIDRDIDLKMKRTNSRPVASGNVKPLHAMLFGIILNAIAFGILWQWANLLSAFLTLSATLFYIFVYTLGLKRRTTQNIVIGGAAGSIPPMVGWAAVTGSILDPSPIILFAIVFLWTPPHFWALALYRRDEYAKANVPMLPVTHGPEFTRIQLLLYTIILTAVTFLPFATKMSGYYYFVSVLFLDLGFLWLAIRLYRSYSDNLARWTFRYSIFYLTALFFVLLVDHQL